MNAPRKALCLLLAIVAAATVTVVQAQAAPCDPQSTNNARTLLNCIQSCANSGHIIAGQHLGNNEGRNTYSAAINYDKYITALGKNSNKIVLVGADYGYSWPPFKGKTTEVNAPLIAHWQKGGAVTVMFSMRNLETGGISNDRRGNFDEILREGTAANRSWRAQLDEAAEGLLELQNAGVPVLFRPLHENNGAWFWWGNNPRDGSVSAAPLWKDMYNYLTRSKGLHNLLWVFSASVPAGPAMADVLTHYPGNEYVDIVALDIYDDTFTQQAETAYAKLQGTGKPFAIAEFGPGKNTAATASYDYTTLLAEIKRKMPRTTYFMVWSDWQARDTQYKSLVSNRNADCLLRDPQIMSTEEFMRCRR